jgi:hypothetical protein
MTVDSLIKLEQNTGQSLIKLTSRLSEGSLTLSEIASIITPAIRGGGADIKEDEVIKIIYQSGIADGIRVCGELLANVLAGGQEDDEKKEIEAP